MTARTWGARLVADQPERDKHPRGRDLSLEECVAISAAIDALHGDYERATLAGLYGVADECIVHTLVLRRMLAVDVAHATTYGTDTGRTEQ